MPARNDPAALRWLIGVELANYRKEAALTQVEAARRAGLLKPKLSSMESGRYQQNPADVAKLLRSYGVRENVIERITSLNDRADSHAWWAPWAHVIAAWNKTFVGLEGMATHEFTYEPTLIPGLLQTRGYSDELTRAGGFVRPDHNDRFVAFRMARADRLALEPRLKLHAVISEAALRLRVGSPKLRRSQLEHLLAMSEQPNVTVQVVRPEDGAHTAINGQFTVLAFDAARPIAYCELLDNAVYVQQRDKIAVYTLAADNLRDAALSPTDSAALIRSMITASKNK